MWTDVQRGERVEKDGGGWERGEERGVKERERETF